MIGGDDPQPWNALPGGTIVALERDGDAVRIIVTLQATRTELVLAGCDSVRYQPHDEPEIYELAEIAASEPDIERAAYDHGTAGRAQGAMVVTGGAGVLRLQYANLVTASHR